MKSSSNTNRPRRFVAISTCPEIWGGSEELWSRAAIQLAEQGHNISVFKTVVDRTHPSIRRLKSLSCSVRDLDRIRVAQRFVDLVLPVRYQLTPVRKQVLFVALHLKTRRPDLVVVSQGDNYDGLHFGQLCRKLKLPYILMSQKATDHFWPSDKARHYMREVFQSAVKTFFVSRHNLNLTEDQVDTKLENAELVRNPFLVTTKEPLPWPENEKKGFRLACVGRLFLLDKGQDILLRVLATEKWKNRDLYVSFFGQGINREGLKGLANRLDVRKVTFRGQTNDVQGIWTEHHALVMPSRSEGLPLALVEAMLCGRTAIATDVGGNRELIDDDVTGFLAGAASEAAFDAALERAWTRRYEWREMGRQAAIRIRELVPSDPAGEFAERLLEIADGSRKRVSDPVDILPVQELH